jgi:hypothetical protein
MNSQLMQQLRDLPSFCAALYELAKVDNDKGLIIINGTSILSFKNGHNLQIVNFWTLQQAILLDFTTSDTSAEARQYP